MSNAVGSLGSSENLVVLPNHGIDHETAFSDFVYWEDACGGPDPHMRVAERIARLYYPSDPSWFIGCYVALYNVPAAEVIAANWSRGAVQRDPEGFIQWCEENFKLLPRRKERTVNGMSARKLASFLTTYARWLETSASELNQAESFDDAFEVVLEVPHCGRYFGMKLYEALRRTTGTPAHAFTDIRPRDGRLSRKTLALLHPEHDYKSNAPEYLEQANELARAQGRRLFEERGVKLDWFKLEVMLCNYRQAIAGSQYPGRAHDSELGHLYKARENFPEVEFKTLEARADLFPHECLGELSGWDGRRVELGRCLPDHGYTWSDLKFSWDKSKDNLEEPVER